MREHFRNETHCLRGIPIDGYDASSFLTVFPVHVSRTRINIYFSCVQVLFYGSAPNYRIISERVTRQTDLHYIRSKRENSSVSLRWC